MRTTLKLFQPDSMSRCLLRNLLSVSLKLYLLVPELSPSSELDLDVLSSSTSFLSEKAPWPCLEFQQTSNKFPFVTTSTVALLSIFIITHSFLTNAHACIFLPFTCHAFTESVFVAKEVLSIVASDLVAWGHVPQYQNTCSVAARRNKLQTHTHTDANQTNNDKIKTTSCAVMWNGLPTLQVGLQSAHREDVSRRERERDESFGLLYV